MTIKITEKVYAKLKTSIKAGNLSRLIKAGKYGVTTLYRIKKSRTLKHYRQLANV